MPLYILAALAEKRDPQGRDQALLTAHHVADDADEARAKFQQVIALDRPGWTVGIMLAQEVPAAVVREAAGELAT